MNDGWVKLHRQIIDNSIFKNPHLYRLATYLVMRANHKDAKVFIGYEEVFIKRGQFIMGERSMSKILDISPSTLRRQIKVLESKQFLERESKHKFSIITIVKYEYYQGEEQDCEAPNEAPSEAQVKRERSVSEALVAPNNNNKNEKNEKKIYPECYDLATLLKDRIIDNNPKAVITNNQLNKWIDIARLMVEVDKIDIKDIRTAIVKSQADKQDNGNWKGWSKVILSMQNVRKHFNKLIDIQEGSHGKVIGGAKPVQGKYANISN